MKIAVFSLTRDRLAFTRDCFQSLQDKAGIPYDHFIWDNGSTDGTVTWLFHEGDRFKQIYAHPENVGIAKAMNALKSMIPPCDLVVKFDNDCLVLTDNILDKISKLYKRLGNEQWVLSPVVEGLSKPPAMGPPSHVHDANPNNYINMSISPAWIGGLFRVMPYNLFMEFTADENLPKAYGVDGQLHQWCEKKGIQMGYINELRVEHYRGTEEQVRIYPDYFLRKFREEKEKP